MMKCLLQTNHHFLNKEGPLGTRIRQEKSPLSHGRKKRKIFDRNLPKLASEINFVPW